MDFQADPTEIAVIDEHGNTVGKQIVIKNLKKNLRKFSSFVLTRRSFCCGKVLHF